MIPDQEKARIFIVEDENAISADLKSGLRRLGYPLRGHTSSPKQALEQIRSDQTDLVLMDIALKRSPDRIKTAEIVGCQWGIPIVFLIPFDRPDLLEGTYLSGPFGYLLKPFSDQDLKVALLTGLNLGRIEKERRKTEFELNLKSETLEHSLNGYGILDGNGQFLYANGAYLKMWGYDSLEEILGTSPVPHGATHSIFEKIIASLNEKGVCRIEFTARRKNGTCFEVLMDAQLAYDSMGREIYVVSSLDITERRKAEESQKHIQFEKEQTIEFLNLINASRSIGDLARIVTENIRNFMKIEAVGIRLKEGFDYPYFETKGFPEDFVQAERYLCARTPKGQLILNSLGSPVLECMCGNILSGRYDPRLPFFSESGSFWTNSTSELLARTTEKERQARTRNRCNGEGYESVALIPLRLGNETYGLIQLNDSQKDRFTIQTISMMERLADQITIAIAQKIAEEKIKTALQEKEILLKELHHRVKNNMQVIISLMNLQSHNSDDELIKATLLDSQSRIYAIATVHEILHQSDTLSTVDLAQYLSRLCESTFQTYRCPGGNIKLTTEINALEVSLERSYPIGLIINELLSNALKYAFPEGRNGEVRLTGNHENRLATLVFADDGVGMPAGFNALSPSTLGLKIVQMLTEGQLGGTIRLDTTQGTRWEMTFPL